ncbi:MAG: hypothetical protein QM784_11860 [Polyangiaceae bacterium]
MVRPYSVVARCRVEFRPIGTRPDNERSYQTGYVETATLKLHDFLGHPPAILEGKQRTIGLRLTQQSIPVK